MKMGEKGQNLVKEEEDQLCASCEEQMLMKTKTKNQQKTEEDAN